MTYTMEQRLTHFDLGPDELGVLRSIGGLIVRDLDMVLQRFYDFALDSPVIAEFFADPKIIAHAREAQKKHWARMFQADLGKEYLQSCERVGRVHFRIELPFTLYLSSYARATSDIQGAVVKRLGRRVAALSPDYLVRCLNVLNKVFALDTELVIDAYFKAQSEELGATFQQIESAITALSSGDLTHHVAPAAEGGMPERYDHLRTAWNDGIDRLCSAISAITQTSDHVRGTAVHLESAATGLSHRTESQAASLEETAAAMQELTRSVAASRQKTDKADTIAREAHADVAEGVDVVQKTANAMDRIRTASEEINQIISLIDDIAFQTNLLALNAGVEAARAGEAGRGFAVVASEVRTLAGSSSEAAQRIKRLINRSAEEVDSGVALVAAANQTLDRIVQQFERVSGLTSDIATASAEQATSIKEVSNAVAEMDVVTQKNAGMVNETTTELKILLSGAEDLKARIDHFRIADGAAQQTPPSAAALRGAA